MNSIRSKATQRWIHLVVLTAVLMASTPVLAEQRQRVIYLNAQRLNQQQMAMLDQLNCNTVVPNGRYWIDPNTGGWGFEGGPQQGIVGHCEHRPRTDAVPRQGGGNSCAAKYRFWEDRMCYCHGVC